MVDLSIQLSGWWCIALPLFKKYDLVGMMNYSQYNPIYIYVYIYICDYMYIYICDYICIYIYISLIFIYTCRVLSSKCSQKKTQDFLRFPCSIERTRNVAGLLLFVSVFYVLQETYVTMCTSSYPKTNYASTATQVLLSTSLTPPWNPHEIPP